MKESENKCSFCGRGKREVNLLNLRSNCPNMRYVCCQANDIINEESDEEQAAFDFSKFKLLKPIEIKKFLDQYVIGQDEAKKFLSVAVYNHYKRFMHVSRKTENRC